MTEQAQKIISQEKEEQTGVLNLNNCGLKEIPTEVFEMDWVKVLNLSNGRYWDRNDNFFRNLPAEVFGDKKNEIKLNKAINIPSNIMVLSLGNSIFEMTEKESLDIGNLQALDLSSNNFSDLTFIKNGESLVHLDLFNNNFSSISSIFEKCTILQYLNLRHNNISEIEELSVSNNLEVLLLGQNKIKEMGNISQFYYLRKLDLAVNEIKNIDGLESLYVLEDLSLSQNKITKIENLWINTELRTLRLSFNPIYKIENLEALEKLTKLKLNNTEISEIERLDELQYLQHLDLSSNKIVIIDNLYENHNLNYLNLSDNPISTHYGIIFKSLENHWPTLRNYFERQNEKDKIDIKLPVKVLLLGNHASGKSTFLNFLKTDMLDKEQESTHILKIDYYKVSNGENTGFELPDAIFYDFGGQDYYHGIYKTFLSKDSLYILLWKNSTNENCCLPDSNGLSCTHFNLDYWFGQKKYLETEKWSQSGTPNPTFLIQSHFDVDGKKNSNIDIEGNGIIDELAVSLGIEKDIDLQEVKNSAKHKKLQAFKEVLNEKIIALKQSKQEPKWYVDFLSLIFNGPHSHIPYTLDEIFPKYKRLMDSDQEKVDFFIDDLEQLHYRGLILYYKEINQNLVWLSPSQFAEYVHTNLLGKEIIKNEYGKIDKSKFEENLTNEGESYIIEILKEQKVIFFDEVDNEYIVPGYLKLTNEDDFYNRDSRGTKYTQFVLKFEKYLPFGFMNQLICFYGSLPNDKWYWRDEMIFFINDIKVQVKLDFCKLEISVKFIDVHDKKEIDYLRNYLFYSIVSLYWDLETLDFPEFKLYLENEIEKGNVSSYDPLCNQMIDYDILVENPGCRPSDLKVSLDGTHFISYQNFWEDCKKDTVTCWIRDEEGKLSSQTTTDANPFRHLFKNKYFDFNIEKIFKIAISYAKEDHSMELYGYNPIQELYENLNILAKDYNMEIFIDWDIDENNWDRQIRDKFNEADLIIVMNSTNYNRTDKKYIWEVEMPIINSKYDNKELSVLRINISDMYTPNEVRKFNDFKKGIIPAILFDRNSFFKDIFKIFIKELIN